MSVCTFIEKHHWWHNTNQLSASYQSGCKHVVMFWMQQGSFTSINVVFCQITLKGEEVMCKFGLFSCEYTQSCLPAVQLNSTLHQYKCQQGKKGHIHQKYNELQMSFASLVATNWESKQTNHTLLHAHRAARGTAALKSNLSSALHILDFSLP